MGLVAMEQPSFGIIFRSKKRFEKSIPTDSAKLLEHSFSRMTWHASIRWYAESVFGLGIGLTAKERNKIRAAGGVLAMGASMPRSVCELQR